MHGGRFTDTFIDDVYKIKNIDPSKGIEYSGSEQVFKKVLSEYAQTGYSRADAIEEYYNNKDYRNYTIQVHALKSASRIIGAIPLSNLAKALEQAGNEENDVKIENATRELLRLYREVVTDLLPLFTSNSDLPMIDESELKDALVTISESAGIFDFDTIDMIMEQLKQYQMPEKYAEIFTKLKTLVAEVASDDIQSLLKDI